MRQQEVRMKLSYLLKGLPGHPLHPPLTDATIGAHTAATAFGLLSALGVSEHNTATAWWLALMVGLVVTAPTALTGLIDWLGITWGSPLWRTATLHLFSMLTATVFFLLAAIFGHGGYVDGEVTGGSLILTLVGFGFLTLGGWLVGRLAVRAPLHAARGARVRGDRPAGAALPLAGGFSPLDDVRAGPARARARSCGSAGCAPARRLVGLGRARRLRIRDRRRARRRLRALPRDRPADRRVLAQEPDERAAAAAAGGVHGARSDWRARARVGGVVKAREQVGAKELQVIEERRRSGYRRDSLEHFAAFESELRALVARLLPGVPEAIDLAGFVDA